MRHDFEWETTSQHSKEGSQGYGFEGYDFLSHSFDYGESQSYAEWVRVAQQVITCLLLVHSLLLVLVLVLLLFFTLPPTDCL